MKLVENVCAFLTKKVIIPAILENNPSARLISEPRVTRGGYFSPAVMSKGGNIPLNWCLPAHCNMILIPGGRDYILWNGKKIIEVEE